MQLTENELGIVEEFSAESARLLRQIDNFISGPLSRFCKVFPEYEKDSARAALSLLERLEQQLISIN